MRRPRRGLVGPLLTGALGVLLLWSSSPAGAAPAPGGDGGTRFPSGFRKAEPWEYVAAPVAVGVGVYLRFWGPQADVNWRGGLAFDDAIGEPLAVTDVRARKRVSVAGNAIFYGAMAYRVIDSLIVPLAVHDDPDLALQLSITDLEAFGTVAVVLWGAQTVVVRERPLVTRRCDDPEFREGVGLCDPDSRDRNRSFIAGHPATVLAAAGVTCLHHAKLRLYGGAADGVACGAMIGATALSAAERLMTEMHYPSDVLIGLALGAVAGWGVPLALSYAGAGTQAAPDAAGTRLRVAPWMAGDAAGLSASGDW